MAYKPAGDSSSQAHSARAAERYRQARAAVEDLEPIGRAVDDARQQLVAAGFRVRVVDDASGPQAASLDLRRVTLLERDGTVIGFALG